MSDENVEFVSLLQPDPEVNLVEIFGDDRAWENISNLVAPLYGPDTETGFIKAGERSSNRGIAGLRQTWLDWLAPWETYRAEIERYVDCGEHVLVITNDFGRKDGMTKEVRLLGAAVWTIRDGIVARALFYADRQDALDELGLDAAILDDE